MSIPKTRLLPVLAALVSVSIGLTACGGASSQPSDSANASQSSGASTVTIEDNRGSVTVPVPAKSVIVTDNRLFQPLQEWGVKLSAAPQDLMPKGSPYKTDSSIVNLGDHREPNMEAAVGVQPDLIINGQRFEEKYDQFKQLAPEAALVDIDIRKDKPFGDELKRQITIAGEIFGKKNEAAKLVSDFDASIARVKAAYKSGSKVMAVIETATHRGVDGELSAQLVIVADLEHQGEPSRLRIAVQDESFGQPAHQAGGLPDRQLPEHLDVGQVGLRFRGELFHHQTDQVAAGPRVIRGRAVGEPGLGIHRAVGQAVGAAARYQGDPRIRDPLSSVHPPSRVSSTII